MRRAVRIIVVLCLLVLAMPYVLTLAYSTGHPVSTLMIGRWFTGQPVMREWRDLTEIAPALARAVIAAEDARFCSHRGIDWGSLQEAIEDAQEGDSGGGGSTITQQTAKNLFLWPGRSFIRKGLEIPLAMWVDFVLPKRRILEIYLNIAEMGPSGQFGAEAAAQYAFGRPARALSPHCSPPSCPTRCGGARKIPVPACGGWPRAMSAGPAPRRKFSPACAEIR